MEKIGCEDIREFNSSLSIVRGNISKWMNGWEMWRVWGKIKILTEFKWGNPKGISNSLRPRTRLDIQEREYVLSGSP
jgi:hypothetical protein